VEAGWNLYWKEPLKFVKGRGGLRTDGLLNGGWEERGVLRASFCRWPCGVSCYRFRSKVAS